MPSKSFASLKPMAIPKQQPPHQYRKSRQKCHGNSHQKLLRLGEEDTRIHTADSKQPPQPSNNPSSNLDQQHQQHQQLVISKTLVLLLVTAQSLLLLLISSQQVVVVVEAQNAVYRPYRPIQNIFGSLFRPGVGGPPPPHPPPHPPLPNQRGGRPQQQPQQQNNNNNNSKGNSSNNSNKSNPVDGDNSNNPGPGGGGGNSINNNNTPPQVGGGGGGVANSNVAPPPPPPAPPAPPPQHQHPPGHRTPRDNVPPPPPPPPHPPRRILPRPRNVVPVRGGHRIVLRPQGPHGPPLIGPLPKNTPPRPPPPHPPPRKQQQQQPQNHHNHNNKDKPPSLGQVLSLVTSTTLDPGASSTPPSTTGASTHAHHHHTIHAGSHSDELVAPSTPNNNNYLVIDELSQAVPATPIESVPNSLEDTFLPPPTAAAFVGSPPGLKPEPEPFESQTLSPTFQVQPRGHSAPVIISQVPVKSFQSSNQVVKEPMPNKHGPNNHNHNHHNRNHDHGHHEHHEHHEPHEEHHAHGHGHHNSLHPHDLSTADSKISEQLLTPYPQPRYYDPILSRTFDSQRLGGNSNRARQNSKRFHFGNHHANDGSNEDHSGEHGSHRNHRLLNHGINVNGSPEQHNEITERIDEVRELVDCGGRDLGFCDMSSKYPGHMMGNLMSDCQELVYSGFVPVPEDLDELGDSNPVAKYSNSSKSAVRAQTGSWSWKPYTYEKKQVCDSELRFIRPGYARDSTGKWQVIVQTDHLPQRVAIDLCHSPGKPCHMMSDCGRKSRCVQRYNFQHLLAVDPDNLHNCPTIRAFKFPSACVCHIEFPNHHEDYY